MKGLELQGSRASTCSLSVSASCSWGFVPGSMLMPTASRICSTLASACLSRPCKKDWTRYSAWGAERARPVRERRRVLGLRQVESGLKGQMDARSGERVACADGGAWAYV